MSLATWTELVENYCAVRNILNSDGRYVQNPHFEQMASRRYNYSPVPDLEKFRFVFLRGVLENSTNATLRRGGRFIWCKDLLYEGKMEDNLRYLSFVVDNGSKRFSVAETNILCIPSNCYVNNNRYFRTKDKTFAPFSSPFGYNNVIESLAQNHQISPDDLFTQLDNDRPFGPGSLVSPRKGYFYPNLKEAQPVSLSDPHPYGLVLGPSLHNNRESGRDFYRVRFGNTTYERIHPIQMELINEV